MWEKRVRQVFKFMRKHHRVIGLSVVLIGLLWTYMSIARNEKSTTLEYLRLYSQIYRLVQDAYLEETDPAILVEGTIEGMAVKANPYNSLEPLAGSSPLVPPRGAVDSGLILGYSEPFLKVIDVRRDSPAAQKGILPGALVLRIGDQGTPFLPVLRANRMLTGDVGSHVELVIQNTGSYKIDEIDLELSTSTPPEPLQFETHDWGLLCRIEGSLTGDQRDLIARTVKGMDKKKGLILDVRHYNEDTEENGLELADLFIPDGRIMAEICNQDGSLQRSVQAGDGIALTDFPLIVVCDATSAGPAESLILAIRNTSRGLIVGERTFGRCVQLAHERLEDTYLLHLVAGYYGNSSCETPHGKGIAPDFMTVLPSPVDDADPILTTAITLMPASSKGMMDAR